jgi:hypothetical protein
MNSQRDIEDLSRLLARRQAEEAAAARPAAELTMQDLLRPPSARGANKRGPRKIARVKARRFWGVKTAEPLARP